MRLKKYTEEQLKDAVKNSFSIIGTLRLLRIREAGGNYRTIHKAIKKYKLDISHFTGQGHLKGKTHNYNSRTLEEILTKGKHENSHMIRKRLLKEKVKQHKCENCCLDLWLSKPIPLELHHIDGNHENNELINLQLLCPNCHTLTDNYRGKNKKNKREKYKKEKYKKEKYIKYKLPMLCCKPCLWCKNPILTKDFKAKFCNGLCANKFNGKLPHKTKITWLPIPELIKLVNEIGYSAAGRKLGVSDNAIRKHLKSKL